MSREVIIRCNHCGNIIEGDPYKVYLERVDRETEDFLVSGKLPAFERVEKMDWCGNCFHNLTQFLLDTSHLLLAHPAASEGKIVPEMPVLAQERNEGSIPETSSGGGSPKETKEK